MRENACTSALHELVFVCICLSAKCAEEFFLGLRDKKNLPYDSSSVLLARFRYFLRLADNVGVTENKLYVQKLSEKLLKWIRQKFNQNQ